MPSITIDHAMFEQIFGTLEAFGQFFADRLFDHALPGKADKRAGFCNLDIAEHRVACGDAAGGRVGQHNDIGQACLTQHLDRDGRARHLHQAENTFLHARAAGGGEDDIRAFGVERTTSESLNVSYVNWQLRMEMKL